MGNFLCFRKVKINSNLIKILKINKLKKISSFKVNFKSVENKKIKNRNSLNIYKNNKKENFIIIFKKESLIKIKNNLNYDKLISINIDLMIWKTDFNLDKISIENKFYKEKFILKTDKNKIEQILYYLKYILNNRRVKIIGNKFKNSNFTFYLKKINNPYKNEYKFLTIKKENLTFFNFKEIIKENKLNLFFFSFNLFYEDSYIFVFNKESKYKYIYFNIVFIKIKFDEKNYNKIRREINKISVNYENKLYSIILDKLNHILLIFK